MNTRYAAMGSVQGARRGFAAALSGGIRLLLSAVGRHVSGLRSRPPEEGTMPSGKRIGPGRAGARLAGNPYAAETWRPAFTVRLRP